MKEKLKFTNEELKRKIDEFGLTFRYFDNKYNCCDTGISVGWRQTEEYVEYGISVRNILADNHDKRIAKENIVNRFINKQTVKIQFYNGLKDIYTPTQDNQVRNIALVKLFIAIYNERLFSPKSFGMYYLPEVYLNF